MIYDRAEKLGIINIWLHKILTEVWNCKLVYPSKKMKENPNISNRLSKSWHLDKINISHNIIDYKSYGKQVAIDDGEFVRMHFGLQGSYDFIYAQLNSSFSLSGHHNNIMYSDGLEIEVENKSKRIETFGINFNIDSFISIGQNGNDILKRFTGKVIDKKHAILSPDWRTNNFKIQQVIQEIVQCNYENELRDLFLLSKSIELLVLQAEVYEKQVSAKFIKSDLDKRKLKDTKDLLSSRLEDPPTIVELAKLIGLNEYKLKKGFKELFGTTIFGYIHNMRMTQAKRLLLGTSKSAKEIAFDIGYSSPQHFSNAFKKKFGMTPNSVRKNPYSTLNKAIDD